MISSPKLNEKGQAFEAYRVLIAMVISLAILVIILSAVSYFDELRKKVSTDTVYSSWKSAVDSPNGKVVEARNLYFTKDTRFNRRQFGLQVGLDEACLVLDAEKSTGYQLVDTDPLHPYVQVLNNLSGEVYFQCSTLNDDIGADGGVDCFAYCRLSFGKTIVPP
ncbi:MAG: hypothetical protein AABX02_01195 [archaeon]